MECLNNIMFEQDIYDHWRFSVELVYGCSSITDKYWYSITDISADMQGAHGVQ